MNYDYWATFTAKVYDISPAFWDIFSDFLGNYAFEVMAAYIVSLGLLILVVRISVRRSRKVRAQLAEVEARRDRHNV